MLGKRLEAAAIGQHGQVVHRRHTDRGELRLDHARKIPHEVAVLVVQFARLDIDDAQRAQLASIGRPQRAPRVEADARSARHQRIVMESCVGQRVGHHENVVAEDRVPAKRDLARCFGHRKADAGLEPLPVLVDQADERDRHPEQSPGQAGQAVEPLFRRGIQDPERPQAVDPGVLVFRFDWRLH